MKLCVVGLGYIGLPAAAMFAHAGADVIGIDINSETVENLNRGKVSIEEPGLTDFISEVFSAGRLSAAMVPCEADAFIIAVPTPSRKGEDGIPKADMSAVEAAAESIVPFLRKGNIVVLESTSPPGTVSDLLCPIFRKSGLDPYRDLYLAHVPERVMPGLILKELINGNRIIGGLTPEAAEKASELYRFFVKGEIIQTEASVAEMCKLMENTYRDVNIALANELSKICEKLGLNVWDVIKLTNKHPRVNIHTPGPGVGGHCIAVDPWFVAEKAPDEAKLITLSRNINDGMPAFTAAKIEGILKKPCKIAILGITFKPDIDDMRESPIEKLYEILISKGNTVCCHDCHVKRSDYCTLYNLDEAVTDAELLVLGVHHSEFKALDFEAVREKMKVPRILDTRGFLDGGELRRIGFEYYLLGDGR